MIKKKVVITDCNFPNVEAEISLLSDIAEVELFQCKNEDEVIQSAKDAEAIIVQYADITASVFDKLPKLKFIARYGVGLDMIDLDAAEKSGVKVSNVPDYCIEEVSDHTVSLILSAIRQIPLYSSRVKKGVWKIEPNIPVKRIKDYTVGLIAYGNISRLTAQKLKGFNCRLLTYAPTKSKDYLESEGLEQVDFETCITEADIISIHIPLTEETYHLFNEEVFKKMKKNSYIVNTSRGEIIDENALFKALKNDEIAGAAVDVMEEEPPSKNNPLLKLENFIVTPHSAFLSDKSMGELQYRTAKAVYEFLRSELDE